jgi:Na+/H+-dicarboxylate symporter
MASDTKKRFHFSLSTYILLGLLLGVLVGLFFGEYSARLQIIGDAFIKLLQMSILPYIVVSLITGIGSLSFVQAKSLARKAGVLLLLFWAVGFFMILVLPLAFPEVDSGSFFSTSLIAPKKHVDFVDLYIPANPFKSLANNVVPAVVLFSIFVGVALMGAKEKEGILKPLSILSDALIKVANYIVFLTPIGVFAISASAAGTMTVEQFGRLQVYFITFLLGTLLLTFLILPLMVSAFTPFRYKDIVGVSKDALITGFTTGNLFIILPVLIQNCKKLFKDYRLEHSEIDSSVDIIVPVSFNFPNLGKLLMLLFILFAGWFYGSSVSLLDITKRICPFPFLIAMAIWWGTTSTLPTRWRRTLR